MNRRRLFVRGIAAGIAAVVAGVAVPARVQARGWGESDIVGSWLSTVTATNPPLGQFTGLITFHEGGTLTESRRYLIPATPLGDLLETTGHGAWERSGRGEYEAFFRFLLQDASIGAPLGTDNIRLWLGLDRRTDTLQGQFQSQIKDPDDNVVFIVDGEYGATRIRV